MKKLFALAFALGFIGISMAETPIKTIPWNGHVGAVSFTFDDALTNQVQVLKPILEELPDVKVTFFVTDMGNGLATNAAGFASLAKAGHEIGNHTQTHAHLSGVTDENELNKEIVQYADNIEKVLSEQGADVRVVSLATPYCENNDLVKSVIETRHFINRDCGWHGRNDWDVEPDWMSLKAKVWTRSGATVDEMLLSMDTAAYIGNFEGANPWDVQVKGGSWLVVLNHGVTEDTGDDYSIDPADIKKILERAVEDKLWIAPFGTVGAYHRAHFILDTAAAVPGEDCFTVSWEIPNEHMPRSVPLRVNIDTESVGENAVVEQDGIKLKAESDGSYIIEFMSKSLKVRKPTADDVSEDTATVLPKMQLENSAYAKYTLFDLNGNRLGATDGFAVPANFPKGAYIVRAESRDGAVVTKKVLK